MPRDQFLGGPTYWKSEPLCVSHGTRHSDVQIGVNLAPFMIHELLLSPTETASGSHPCCVVSVTYHRPSYFHGGNTGSNPVGDANVSMTYKFLDLLYRSLTLHPE